MDDPFDYFTSFKPVNTAERVYAELKRMLFAYQIVPGQKLQYQDLAERFKVSRTPVKDALNMLEKEGYIALRHNKGYYVAEIGLREAEELYEIREALEVLAVQKAIEHLDRATLKILKEGMEAYAADVRKPLSRKRLILDAIFHLKIAEMAQNKALVEIIRMVFSKIYLKHKVETLSVERGREADLEHRELFHAIQARKLALAVAIVRKHIASSKRNVLGDLLEES